jgi:uncharacterized short protein YbdD (DUF466 family)
MGERTRNRHSSAHILRGIRLIWRGVREWCGDTAYEKYLASRATREAVGPSLTRTEFYVEQANRRFSRPNRCC